MLSNMFVRGLSVLQSGEGCDYSLDLPVTRGLMALGTLEFNKPVTFFAGENGAGKSTLLEAMAVCCGFNAEGGTRNFNFSSAETHSALFNRLRLIRGVRRPSDGFFLRAESFYNVATEVDRLNRELPSRSFLNSYGGKSLHCQSHGESFIALVANRFRTDGLYLLDEPEAALSPTRQMALLAHIHRLAEAGAQFIIASHSPILMAYPGADIYVLGDGKIELTPYEETEHYIITKQFLNNPEKLLKILFEE